MAERLIHILPEHVASQIAAGEVVERPASALKELVENSLDAGARTISAEIERGGSALIAVADDGCGMVREDAVLSLRRHATSKIRDAADLAAIHTFGFRGEALASIASVSRLVLQTRRANDETGVELIVTGGDLEQTRGCAMAPGTRIEVRELFFNTPARLKFLKTSATEQAAAAEALQRLALANPQVAFRLNADGRTLFDLPRAVSVLERVRQLFGPKLADRMLGFELEDAGMRAWGLLTMSQESFPTPRQVFTFVNRRAVRDRALMRAVALGYETLIPRGRYPAVALFLELRPEDVDVNVHPMKSEVRFRRSGAAFELVYHAVRARLADQNATAGSLPASRASEMTPATREMMRPPVYLGSGVSVLATESGGSASGEAAGAPAPRPRGIGDQPERSLRLVADTQAQRAQQGALRLGFGRGGAIGAAAPEASPPPAAIGASIPLYSSLRIVGQIFAGYIALESDNGLILVDQHAAHERVTFERLRAELRSGGIRVQALLTPATLDVNPARAAQVMASIPQLRAMGFDVEPFGDTTLILKGAPAVFGADGGLRLLTEMIDSMGEHGFQMRGEAAFDDWLKQLACHGSVRVGRALSPPEITALLAELDRTEFKSNCPHGRPVHIQFARGQLERMFRR